MLAELKTDFEFEEKDRERLLDELWVIVEGANGMYRPEARIERSRIVIVSANKPLPRNPTGMVQRRRCLELYKAELEAL